MAKALLPRQIQTASVPEFGFDFLKEGAKEVDEIRGIVPFLPLNHRLSTSLYYRDPDGNEVELSVDNFRTKEECNSFIRSDGMAEIGRPPFGYTFDADELARLFHSGAPERHLAQIGIPQIDQGLEPETCA